MVALPLSPKRGGSARHNLVLRHFPPFFYLSKFLLVGSLAVGNFVEFLTVSGVTRLHFKQRGSGYIQSVYLLPLFYLSNFEMKGCVIAYIS